MADAISFPKLDEALIERLIPLAEELDDLSSSGADCSQEIDRFNLIGGTAIRDSIAFHFSGSCSSRAFVRDALATTHLSKYSGLADDALISIIGLIQQGEHPEEVAFWLQVLDLNLPGAAVFDLLFFPSNVPSLAAHLSEDPTPLEILRAARALASARRSAAPTDE